MEQLLKCARMRENQLAADAADADAAAAAASGQMVGAVVAVHVGVC